MRTNPLHSSDYELRAFSSVTGSNLINTYTIPRGKRTMVQNSFLAVVPTEPLRYIQVEIRSIYRARPRSVPLTHNLDGIWGREISQHIDFNVVKEWLQFCQTFHRGDCMDTKSRDTKELKGFRLIDCDAEPLKAELHPWTEKYVALSYVWGLVQESPHSLSQVVLDAMMATKQLGLRYLWVDKFCIDQENSEEKQYLISNMASIYEGAEVTIIAAAGVDASYGLPGVGTTTRQAQPKARVGDITLVSTYGDPRSQIQNLQWWARGWTYQEGVLSRRRLMFTESQVYWECGGMVTFESIYFHLPLHHTKTNRHMGSYMMPGVFSGLTTRFRSFRRRGASQGSTVNAILTHIKNYATKNLKFDNDSLLAFNGISQRYCLDFKRRAQLRFLLGLPIRADPSNYRTFGPQYSLALALSAWIHLETVIEREGKTTFEDHPRRTHLPSWTWAGWKGAAAFEWNNYLLFWDYLVDNPAPAHQIYTSEIVLTRHSGEVFTNFLEIGSVPDISKGINPILQIKRPFVIREFSFDYKMISGRKALHLKNREAKISISIEGNLPDIIRQLKDGKFKCILMSCERPFRGQSVFLVIKYAKATDGGGTWERVGALAVGELGHNMADEFIKGFQLQRLDSDILLA